MFSWILGWLEHFVLQEGRGEGMGRGVAYFFTDVNLGLAEALSPSVIPNTFLSTQHFRKQVLGLGVWGDGCLGLPVWLNKRRPDEERNV